MNKKKVGFGGACRNRDIAARTRFVKPMREVSTARSMEIESRRGSLEANYDPIRYDDRSSSACFSETRVSRVS